MQLKEQIQKNSPENIATEIEDLKEWQEELANLQKLIPAQASRDRLKLTELPALEKEIQVQEAEIPSISEKAEQVREVCINLSLRC